MTPDERFDAKWTPEPNTGCWLWFGAHGGDGHGQFRYNGRARPAHRYSYERAVGPIPAGLDIDHLCRVTCCVNPEHLEPVTRRENVIRGLAPVLTGARSAKRYRDMATCKRGHARTPENMSLSMQKPRNGYVCAVRTCLPCKRARYAEKKARACR